MKWLEHKELSESDLDFLVGSAMIEKLMRNKLVIKYHSGEKIATPSEMGLHECLGPYHMRQVGGDRKIIEILFEHPGDLKAVQEHLTQYKLGI
jgi:hypothetical protein